MRRLILLSPLISLIINCLPAIAGSNVIPEIDRFDTIDIQVLYNGRAWRNLYYRVRGDQFLFSPEFLPGNVTIDGRTFNNLQIKYDIYNDELLTITDHGIVLQLNKEIIDKFNLKYNNQVYYFKRLDADSLNALSGYVNVLYDGNTSLYVKYRKEILQLAVENKYDMFNQINRIYLEKNGTIVQVKSKMEFLNLLKDHKQQVQNFIKSNKIRFSRKNPEGFRPVIEFYDKLRN